LGTVPNRCLPTVMDALKCVLEQEPFYCHEAPPDAAGDPTRLCRGWVAAMAELPEGTPPLRVPWGED
jgi:hypothetical protein